MDTTQLYERYKPLLSALAYRMLGCVMDAEDIVQDVFVDWERERQSGRFREITQEKAYLCKMVTNRCIDLLRSAKRRRETYVGVWLPEPVVQFVQAGEGGDGDPLEQALLRDSLAVSYLVMLEVLSPVERAVFVLREVFAYEYGEIADMLGKKEANCRQILRRVRLKLERYQEEGSASIPAGRIGGERLSAAADLSASSSILDRFIQHVSEGNIDQLMSLLNEQAVLISDGGGKVNAAVRPILGRDRVVRFLLGIAEKLAAARYTALPAQVNGEPGLVLLLDDQTYCTMAFAYRDGQIAAIYNTMNPDKLQHVQPPCIGGPGME